MPQSEAMPPLVEVSPPREQVMPEDDLRVNLDVWKMAHVPSAVSACILACSKVRRGAPGGACPASERHQAAASGFFCLNVR